MAKQKGKKKMPYDLNEVPVWFTKQMAESKTPPSGPYGTIPYDVFGRWKKLFFKNQNRQNAYAARA